MSTSIRHRIEAAGIAYPMNWADMGSSERDLWEDRQIAALDRKSPAAELPEDRVAAYLDALPDNVDVLDEYGYGPEHTGLRVSDVQDVLNELAVARRAASEAETRAAKANSELVGWRNVAAARLSVIDSLSEQLAEHVDPAPQGDPIETEND